MIRLIVVLLLFGFLVPAYAGDGVWRCRDVNGTLFLTDDRDNFPPGCKEEPKGYSRGGLIILPESLMPAERDFLHREELRTRIWQAAAKALADSFREERLLARKGEEWGSLSHLQAQKEQLLRAISEEPLSRQDRVAIEETLAAIPTL
jgi:hypothetical protein